MNHNNDDDDVLSETYDHFREWLKDNKNFKKHQNGNIDARAFADLKKNLHGPTHMCIILENVVEGNEELFKEIKKYQEGTLLKTMPKTSGEGSVYAAYVPYYLHNNDNNNFSYSRNAAARNRLYNNNKGLDTIYLYLYIIGLVVVVFLAITKTNRSDWNFLFGYGK